VKKFVHGGACQTEKKLLLFSRFMTFYRKKHVLKLKFSRHKQIFARQKSIYARQKQNFARQNKYLLGSENEEKFLSLGLIKTKKSDALVVRV
jgi:hypothetical protein